MKFENKRYLYIILFFFSSSIYADDFFVDDNVEYDELLNQNEKLVATAIVIGSISFCIGILLGYNLNFSELFDDKLKSDFEQAKRLKRIFEFYKNLHRDNKKRVTMFQKNNDLQTTAKRSLEEVRAQIKEEKDKGVEKKNELKIKDLEKNRIVLEYEIKRREDVKKILIGDMKMISDSGLVEFIINDAVNLLNIDKFELNYRT
ncbi:hypothetical protein GF322_02390 [Candidatus Dependentiae bacterium]|nr:hypothetical protein [Candidatus Dependentiae bacterium]